MKSQRLLVLLPCLALLCLGRLLFSAGPDLETPADRTAQVAADASAACDDDACGCPHDAVPASCCCAPKGPEAARAPSNVARPQPTRESAQLAADRLVVEGARHAPAVLIPFHCSGAPRGQQAPASSPPPGLVPVLVELRTERPERASEAPFRSWISHDDRMPPTPPPRRLVRA